MWHRDPDDCGAAVETGPAQWQARGHRSRQEVLARSDSTRSDTTGEHQTRHAAVEPSVAASSDRQRGNCEEPTSAADHARSRQHRRRTDAAAGCRQRRHRRSRAPLHDGGSALRTVFYRRTSLVEGGVGEAPPVGIEPTTVIANTVQLIIDQLRQYASG